MHQKNTVNIPKVSIIVPVYNVEKYLRQCIESLINQTLKEIEIICINDGSTDGSEKILREYAEVDHRITVLSKSNTGYGHSMNIGIQHARGEYIGIVESDDFASEDMFEQLYLKAEENDVDVIKSNFFEYRGCGKTYQDNLKGIPYNVVFKTEENPQIFSVAPSIWSSLYRTDFLKKSNIRFQETPGASYQDVSFYFLVLLHATRVICISDAFLNYRIDNINSSIHSSKKVFSIMTEFARIQKFFEGGQKRELLSAVTRAKYKHYKSNYERIDPLFQYAYLQVMNKEFVEDERNGLLDRKDWEREDWDELKQIMEEPERYFINTNIDYINKKRLRNLTVNHCIEIEAYKTAIRKASKIIIYGAGTWAKRLSKEVEALHPIFAFAVTERREGDSGEIDGIKVYEIRDLVSFLEEAMVIVAVKSKLVQIEIASLLQKMGFRDVMYIDRPTLEDI